MKPRINVRKEKGRWVWSCSVLGCDHGYGMSQQDALGNGEVHLAFSRGHGRPASFPERVLTGRVPGQRRPS